MTYFLKRLTEDGFKTYKGYLMEGKENANNPIGRVRGTSDNIKYAPKWAYFQG